MEKDNRSSTSGQNRQVAKEGTFQDKQSQFLKQERTEEENRDLCDRNGNQSGKRMEKK